MPLVRLISEGACEELSLLTDGQQEITVGIEYGPHVTTETHVIPSGGLHIFRLNTADFPHANRISVDAGPCGKVSYAIMKPVQGPVSVAQPMRLPRALLVPDRTDSGHRSNETRSLRPERLHSPNVLRTTPQTALGTRNPRSARSAVGTDLHAGSMDRRG